MSYIGKKWTRGCPADIKLTQLFESGKATFDMAPLSVKQLADEFKPYSDSVFRTHLKQMKAKMGEHLPDSDKDGPLSALEKRLISPDKGNIEGK